MSFSKSWNWTRKTVLLSTCINIWTWKNLCVKVLEDVSWSQFFSHSRKLFSEFPCKTFVIALHDISLAYKIFHCLFANHNPELRCVICTGVTIFAPVLHLNWTALSPSESSNFLMCIIKKIITLGMLFCCTTDCHQMV